MAGSRSSDKQPVLHGPEEASYDVGFRKPPKSTQFKPGQSGNPRGRPKGARNKLPALDEERMKSIIYEEAYRLIKVNDGDRQIKMPVAKAVIRSLALGAAKGQARAQWLFTELLHMTEQANWARSNDYLRTVVEYKCNWEKNLEERKRHGTTGSEPVPHPGDILIDFNNDKVYFCGPMTNEERDNLASMLRIISGCSKGLSNLEAQYQQETKTRARGIIRKQIRRQEKLRDSFAESLLKPWGESPRIRNLVYQSKSVTENAEDAD